MKPGVEALSPGTMDGGFWVCWGPWELLGRVGGICGGRCAGILCPMGPGAPGLGDQPAGMLGAQTGVGPFGWGCRGTVGWVRRFWGGICKSLC